MHSDDTILKTIQNWVDTFIVGQNICPFAAPTVKRQRLRYRICHATDVEEQLETLLEEFQYLDAAPIKEVETTLLILPKATGDFYAFNDFFDLIDRLLVSYELDEEFQCVGFHPDYLFAGCDASDPANYTNRAPYPMLHLLRSSSITQAENSPIDVTEVPERNIEYLRSMDEDTFNRCVAHHFRPHE